MWGESSALEGQLPSRPAVEEGLPRAASTGPVRPSKAPTARGPAKRISSGTPRDGRTLAASIGTKRISSRGSAPPVKMMEKKSESGGEAGRRHSGNAADADRGLAVAYLAVQPAGQSQALQLYMAKAQAAR